MAMAENENEIGAGPKSPWKTPADDAADCPIMTAEAWSELSNGKPNNHEKPAEVVNSGANSANAQASAGQQQISNSSHKHGQSRHRKAGFKRSPKPFSCSCAILSSSAAACLSSHGFFFGSAYWICVPAISSPFPLCRPNA